MDENKLVKFIFRQGIEDVRDEVVYSIGEPVYVTNYKRLFIGDGETVGGVLISNKFLGIADFDYSTNQSGIVSAYKGDLVFDNTSNNLYALTGNNASNVLSYGRITRNFFPDEITTTLTETSAFSVKKLSLNSEYFENTSLGRGLEKSGLQIQLENPSNELYFNINNKLGISPNGVTNDMLDIIQGNHVKGNLGPTGNVEDIPLQTLADALVPLLAGTSSSTALGVPIGTIIDFAGPNPPNGYLLCNGQTVSAQEYPELYNAIGNYWGGTFPFFNLPDLRRKVTVGSGGTTTLTLENMLGAVGGSETTILELKDVPSHVHGFQTLTETISGRYDVGDYGEGSTLGNFSFLQNITENGSDGGLNSGPLGRPINNIQPSAVVNKCIKAF